MAKAANKVKPVKRTLIVRDQPGVSEDNLVRYIEGENCKKINCNGSDCTVWFQIVHEGFRETFEGIPYSIIEPEN